MSDHDAAALAAALGLHLPAELVDRYAAELVAELGDTPTDLASIRARLAAGQRIRAASAARDVDLLALLEVDGSHLWVPPEHAERVADLLARCAAYERVAPLPFEASQ